MYIELEFPWVIVLLKTCFVFLLRRHFFLSFSFIPSGIGFLLLLSKPFSTTNLGVVFNGFGYAMMFGFSTTPYTDDFLNVLKLISRYKVIPQCYKKADHFINLASNSLSIFKNTEEKKILENLTSFSIERSF